MTDLTTLFPPEGQSSERPLVPRDGAAQLRQLVGAGAGDAAANRSPFSSPQALTALVGSSEKDRLGSTTTDLSALWGGAASDADGLRAPSTVRSLSSLVEQPGMAVGTSGWSAPENAQVGRRPVFGTRRRQGSVNFISVAVATVAVLALAGTTTFAVVQRATANPADGAMVSLREQEAELQNTTAVLQTSADLYTGSLAEAEALVDGGAELSPVLQGRVDQAALESTDAARAALAEVIATPVAVAVPAYVRDEIDEKSLADVGRAIDDVRAAKGALPSLVDAARAARATVVSGMDAYRAALLNLGAVIETEAPKQREANDAASEGFRSAVTDAAAAVRAAQVAGGNGVSEMRAYAQAVDALRTENQRILLLRQAEADAKQESPRRAPQAPTPTLPQEPAPQPTSPPDTTPTEPPVPVPDPAPTTPNPDPAPQPEPTQEPPADGGTGAAS